MSKDIVKIYTKEFLDKLSVKVKESSQKSCFLIDFLMIEQKLSFSDAIAQIANFFEMAPDYIENMGKSEAATGKEECLCEFCEKKKSFEEIAGLICNECFWG